MFASQLEDAFRRQIGAPYGADPIRDESVRFAVHFARLLGRVLTEEDLNDRARVAMASALSTRTKLEPAEIDVLIDLALAPQNRVAIGEADLRAFGVRFGAAQEEALRQQLTTEVELPSFAELYGENESLLLLDSLFRVCAVDGRIDRRESARLVRAAAELGIDGMLTGMLFRKYDPRYSAAEITLDRDKYVIGRDLHHDLPLQDPQVASTHAQLFRTQEGWRVFDLGSGRPTLIDGHPVSSAPLEPGAELRIGSFTLTLGPDGHTLRMVSGRQFSSLSVQNLTRRLPSGKVLLDKVGFTVFTGEVVAVVGPSGSGKTTLLHAMAGIAPANEGAVIFDRVPLQDILAEDPAVVGVVPQDDVVHAALTVEESLAYAARLRLPNADEATVRSEVERVLAELDLVECRSRQIGSTERRVISGGQRKRVNVGQELVTQSNRVLFLDEPTSGLDPQTAQDIVRLARQLADDGRIAFLVTHDMSPSILSMVDHLLVLAKGGRVAWFGPPAEATRFFGVEQPDEIFGRLEAEHPQAWAKRYEDSAASRKYISIREHLLGLDALQVEGMSLPSRRRGVKPRSRLRQVATLTGRYLRTKRRDLGGMAVLLAQAPVLALLMWWVIPAPDPATMFMIALSSLWFGASASVRELIADRAIWKREARIGVSSVAYVSSKVAVLGAIVALQCTALTTICYFTLPLYEPYGYDPVLLAGVASLTGWVGMGIGLWIGAHAESSEAAVGTLPLVLIPQIMFGGLVVRVWEMTDKLNWKWGLSDPENFTWLIVTRYSFEALIKTGPEPHLSLPTTSEHLERTPKPLSASLQNLGFTDGQNPDDIGLSLEFLVGAMALFLFVLLLHTFYRTWRLGLGR